MAETYRYLIQYISDIRGIKEAKGKLRELETYNTKFGAKVGKVTKVLGKDIQTSTKSVVGGATKHTRAINRMFQTASGETYKYSRNVTTSGGKVISTTGKLTKASGALGKSLGVQSGQMAKLAVRAISVIPIWMALRAGYMAIIGAIKDLIGTYMGLAKEMGRVAGVTRGTEKDLDLLKKTVLDFSASASRGFKEAASVMYALGSAGLTVTEQLAGMEHIMNVTIGTFGNAERIAKLVAGSYNVFGKSMEGVYTSSEKMKYISDVLAYTYSTQQVELSEIENAMRYVASVGSLVNIKFEDLVATIGVLNTGMLKGSRAGTALMNSFIRLASQSDRLTKLGVVFDPSQPLDFLDIMEQLHNIYGSTALSVVSLREIMEVFGRRGGRAAAQLIHDFDRWRESLENTHKNFHDFAEEMREKAENTLPMALAKLGNAIKANIIDLFSKENLKVPIAGLAEMIDLMAKMREYQKYFPLETAKIPIGGFGQMIPVEPELTRKQMEANKELYILIGQIVAEMEEEKKISAEIYGWNKAINLIQAKYLKNLIDEESRHKAIVEEIKLRTKEGALAKEQIEAIVKKVEEQLGLEKEIAQTAGKLSNSQKEKLKDISRASAYQFMEARGAKKSLVIYRKMLDLVKNMNNARRDTITMAIKSNDEEKLAALTALKEINLNDVILGQYDDLEQHIIHVADAEKQAYKLRKLSSDYIVGKIEEQKTMYSEYARIMSATGISQIQIEIQRLHILEKQGAANDAIYTQKLKIGEAVQQQLNKEQESYGNLVMQYEKAESEEKKRIKRLFELLEIGKGTFGPEILVERYRYSMFDKNIILDYWNYFKEEAHNAIRDYVAIRERLEQFEPEVAGVSVKTEFNLREESAREYAKFLQQEVQKAITGGFESAIISARKLEIVQQQIVELFPHGVEVKPEFGDIILNLPEDLLDSLPEKSAQAFLDKLKTDEALQKFMADMLRTYM